MMWPLKQARNGGFWGDQRRQRQGLGRQEPGEKRKGGDRALTKASDRDLWVRELWVKEGESVCEAMGEGSV